MGKHPLVTFLMNPSHAKNPLLSAGTASPDALGRDFVPRHERPSNQLGKDLGSPGSRIGSKTGNQLLAGEWATRLAIVLFLSLLTIVRPGLGPRWTFREASVRTI